MTRVVYVDGFSGVAGDMLLGAMLDAGLPEAELRRALGTLGVNHDLRVSRVVRAGVTATRAEVLEREESGPRASGGRRVAAAHHHHGDGHVHSHGVAGHRSLAEITHLISHANLSKAARDRATRLFTRLAEVEASIHNMPVDRVHLHEVGALDSIIDIVGCVWGLEWFGADEVVASPLNVGSGTVRIAHGTFPVPAPATLQLLAGVPVYAEGPAVELTTPTGALIVTGHAQRYGPMPPMQIDRVGYGAGSRDFSDRPNVVRLVVGTAIERSTAPGGAEGQVVRIECEIDDMSPQLFGPASDRLFEAGALDVFVTPVFMKKQRPGALLTVIAPVALREPLSGILFRETTTLGVRYDVVTRETLERRFVPVATVGGTVRLKIASRNGEVVGAAPEFEDCARIARRTGRALKLVQADAMRAWLDLEGGGSALAVSVRRTARPRSRRRASRPGQVARSGRSGPRGRK